jgi:AcrR family transcriptional regulator
MKRKAQRPRKTPVQARAKITWNVILDAAAQVLLRRGYEKATTDRIAERAGVSIGSIYEYFPNKESIFAALMLRWNEERWVALSAVRGEDEEPGLEALVRQTVRARIAATLLNPKLNSALNLEVPHHITAVQAKEMFGEFLRVSVEKLDLVREELRDGDLELMAEIVIHATLAIVDNLAASSPERLASKELEDELSLMMYRYFAK